MHVTRKIFSEKESLPWLLVPKKVSEKERERKKDCRRPGGQVSKNFKKI
jgi:hypothetical protein